MPPGAHVLIDQRQLRNMPRSAPRFLRRVPAWWEIIWKSKNALLYKVPNSSGHPDSFVPIRTTVPGSRLKLSKSTDVLSTGSAVIKKTGEYTALISLPRHVNKATFNFTDFFPIGTTPKVALLVRNKTGGYTLFNFHTFGLLEPGSTHSFMTDIPKGDYILQMAFFGGGSTSFKLESVIFE